MTDEERMAYAEEFAQASLAVALAEEMDRRGDTQDRLASAIRDHCGYDYASDYVRGILAGDRNVTLRMAALLADALDCDLKICLLPRKAS